MFERFTDSARQVVVLAQEEARLLNHNYIGTEHLLLGLIREGEGDAARTLALVEIELGTVRAKVEEIIGRGKDEPGGHIPFTPRAKKVLELSLREAKRLKHNYIGTEHILLGLIREGEGVAAQVLVDLGAELHRVRKATLEVVQGADPTEERTAEAMARVTARAGGGFGEVGSSLTSRLTAIEERLSAIEGRLARLEGGGTEASGPAGT